MHEAPSPDWDPKSDAVQSDQRAAYDDMRTRCPVAHSDFLGWTLFRHQDVLRVLNDPGTFSSVVSQHLSVPNGMDPPEHTAYRRIVELYFQPERMAAFAPLCRSIANRLVQDVAGRTVELISEFAQTFAVRAQCAFLGWPPHLHEALRLWTQGNRDASLAEDRPALAKLARVFEDHVQGLLASRRAGSAPAGDDIVASLIGQQVGGRPLNDAEIASILRNWTVGEVGTISASVGILVHWLAGDAGLQQQLRERPALLPEAIDEILRLHGPLVAIRRTATRQLELGGRTVEAGERVSLNWVAANRDPEAFDDADSFRLGRNPADNLLYGAGIHVCPGAPLARLELRLVMEALLAGTRRISLAADRPATLARYPASGFATLDVHIDRDADSPDAATADKPPTSIK